MGSWVFPCSNAKDGDSYVCVWEGGREGERVDNGTHVSSQVKFKTPAKVGTYTGGRAPVFTGLWNTCVICKWRQIIRSAEFSSGVVFVHTFSPSPFLYVKILYLRIGPIDGVGSRLSPPCQVLLLLCCSHREREQKTVTKQNKTLIKNVAQSLLKIMLACLLRPRYLEPIHPHTHTHLQHGLSLSKINHSP